MALAAQLAALHNTMKDLVMVMEESKQPAPTPIVAITPICSLCYGAHAFEECPSNLTSVLYVGDFNYNFINHNQFDQQGWQNQECNFAQNQGQNYQYQQPYHGWHQSFEAEEPFSPCFMLPPFVEQLEQHVAEAQPPNEQWMNQMLENHEAMLQSHGAILKSLEIQMGQIASALSCRPLETLPSDTEIPKRDGKEVCKALHLRNGQQVDNIVTAQPSTTQSSPQDKDDEKETTTEPVWAALKSNESDKLMQNIEVHQPISKAIQIPFPQRLQEQQQEHYLSNNFSSKLKNPGSSLISCAIEETNIVPDGKIENKLVKVYRFIFPTDFMIVDFEADKDVPIILDRPFLVKEDAIIDVEKGKLTMRVNEEKMTFNVLKTINVTDEDVNDYSAISFYDHLVAHNLLLNSEISNLEMGSLKHVEEKQNESELVSAFVSPPPKFFGDKKFEPLKFLEKNLSYSFLYQLRRLSLTMKEIMQKKIIKWLDTGQIILNLKSV
ncbi:uncharacterized protein LOC133300759 [Gastrolobium bilobum]|uniref:uncharacterized protein LOC133300759 n=1 Tax=Gastrolobium bilobum TaxID=150636 RepID=UPI002AB0AC0E|nr:uncharacterized protein LOC133300759 [Gastrolobium bilobum]